MKPNLRLAALVPPWGSNSRETQLPVKVQAALFEIFADLITNGFSLQAAMQFIVGVQGRQYARLQPAIAQLANGADLATALQAYITVDLYYQLLIAEQHGELVATLLQAGRLMRTKTTQQQQIRRLLQYPLVLLGLLIGTLVVVKTAILPNFDQAVSTPASALSWQLMVGSLASIGGLALIIVVGHFKRQPVRARYQQLVRWPIVGPLVRLYCGYYLALNAGMLLSGGLGLRAICEVSRHFKPQSLLQQQGQHVEQALLTGQSLPAIIKADRLLPDELAVLVGKASPAEQLSQELIYFATLQYDRLVRELNRLIGWIQPVMFVIIAVVIVGTYLNILLPMYNSMGDLGK